MVPVNSGGSSVLPYQHNPGGGDFWMKQHRTTQGEVLPPQEESEEDVRNLQTDSTCATKVEVMCSLRDIIQQDLTSCGEEAPSG